MPTNTRYSRRGFLEMVAGSSALGAVAPFLAWVPAEAQPRGARTRFAFIASRAPGKNGVHVFVPGARNWTSVQFVSSEAPSGFAMSADQKILFVANGTRRYENRPTGSVESFRIDRRSGRLSLVSRQALALSAVEPQSLAVSPDGKFLAVAVTGGGSYNLLPISGDGSLGSVAMLRKEIGCGPHSEFQTCARPGQLTFDPNGHLLTTDLGTDRVSSFRPEIDNLRLVNRQSVHAGSGPDSIALHADAGLIFVGNSLNGTIQTHRYDPGSGVLGQGVSRAATPTGSERLKGLVLHPSGEILFSAWRGAGQTSGVTAWQISERGTLAMLDEAPVQGGIAALACTCDGDSVIAVNDDAGTVTSLSLDTKSGTFAAQGVVASVPNATAITFSHA